MDARACLERGDKLYSKHKDLHGAISAYDQAIKLDPLSARAYSNRGAFHLLTGKIEEAFSDFNMAIWLDDKLVDAYVNRSYIYLLFAMIASPADLELSRQDAAEALRLNKNQTNAYLINAISSIIKGHLQTATANIREAGRIKGRKTNSYYQCGLTMLAQARLEIALDHFEIIWKAPDVDIRRKIFAGIQLRRLYCFQCGDKRQNIDLAAQLEKMTVQSPQPTAEKICLIALAQMELGKYEQARQACWTLLKEQEIEYIPDYLREEYLRLLVNPHCWGWPQGSLLNISKSKLAEIKDQLISLINSSKHKDLKLNARLQAAFCSQTLLGDIFATIQPTWHFFGGKASITKGSISKVAGKLNASIALSDRYSISEHTLTALELAKSLNPLLNEEMRQLYPAVYNCINGVPRPESVQSVDEGNRHISDSHL